MNLAFKYFRLQQIDSGLDRAKSRLDAINTKLADQSEIDSATEDLKDAESQLEARQNDLKSSERDTAAQREKIRTTEGQLYGGKIQNPKELQDLERELEALNRHLAVLDDRQFEAMVEMEEAQSRTLASRTRWNDTQADTVQRNASLLGEKRNLEAEISRLDEERRAASGSLGPGELDPYDRLRRSKNGVAVARVTEGTCSACGSTLTPALIQAAQSPNDLTRCPTCNRFLYGG
jgi:predicted  nucleic acid-binding Zn-ribbon protein